MVSERKRFAVKKMITDDLLRSFQQKDGSGTSAGDVERSYENM